MKYHIKQNKTIICIESLLTDGTSTLHVMNSAVENCCRTVHNIEYQGSTTGK